jgi:MoaA/NifB/PqqE/SkfB family radical SAM enzyme
VTGTIDEVIRFGTRCNFNCLFCNVFNNEEINERSLEEMKEIVDSVPRDVQYLSISGGEPMMYPHLDELISYIKKNGWSVRLQTNASLVTPTRAKKLRDLNVNIAFVNLPSHDPEKFAELTGTNAGVFQTVVCGIRMLLDADIPVVLNIVVNELNYKYLVPYLEFVHEQFPEINEVNFSMIQPHGNARINSYLVPDYRNVKPFLKEAITVSGKLGITITNPFCGLPICMVYDSMLLGGSSEYLSGTEIRSNGHIAIPLSRVVDSKMHPPSCSDCYLRNFCLGVWKIYYEIRGDVVEPPHRSLRFWPNS